MKKIRYIFIIIILLTCSSCSTYDSINYEDFMKVHFIDVGQGDAILVQVNNINLLIDSGPKENKRNLLNYLDSLKISTLDYVIATHPHEDHIGNMHSIINRYNVTYFYSPKVTHTSKSFEKMIEALISKNKKINVLDVNTKSIDLGNHTSFTIYSPFPRDYGENLNLYSAVFKIKYKNTSFLFTGDAEKLNENEILNNNISIDADVLKVAHHGSSTSTSSTFLKEIDPRIAVISVGKDNKFNHPTKETLSNLDEQVKLIYRTDIDGTVILISDGHRIYKK